MHAQHEHALSHTPAPVGRCARSMLGPAGAIKICAATDSAGAFVKDGGGAAVCNGIGLLEALSLAHPAASLLKEAVHGQQALRGARRAAFPSDATVRRRAR